jgi:hypothetical protein
MIRNRMWLVHMPTGVGIHIGNHKDGNWYITGYPPKDQVIEEFYRYLDGKDQAYNLQVVQELTHNWDDLGVIEGTKSLRKFQSLQENEHHHMMVPPTVKGPQIPITVKKDSRSVLQMVYSVPRKGDLIQMQIGEQFCMAEVYSVTHLYHPHNEIVVTC